jgi:ABC-type nitrate/sulfonate/bicarbonate transport system substrate-binding protein
MKNKFIFAIGILAILTIALVASCNKPAAQVQSIRLSELVYPFSYATHLALTNGYFHEEGVNVVTIAASTGPDVVTALKAAREGADVGDTSITPIITMIAAGDQPVVIAETLKSDKPVVLAAFQSSGITADPNSLKSHKIGVTKNTLQDFYLSRLLKKAQLSPSDVTLVNGRPPELKALFLRGNIDAAVLMDPYIDQLKREYAGISQPQVFPKGKLQLFVEPGLVPLHYLLVTTKRRLEDNRSAFVALLRAIQKSETYINQNNKAAQQEMERWLMLQPGDLDNFMLNSQFQIKLDIPELIPSFQAEFNWLKESRPDAVLPSDLSSYFDSTLLKEVAPGRVTQ